MLTSIKAKVDEIAGIVKETILCIVTPIIFIAGFLWYVMTKDNKESEAVVSNNNIQKEKLDEIEGEKRAVDAASVDPVAEFERKRAEFDKHDSNR